MHADDVISVYLSHSFGGSEKNHFVVVVAQSAATIELNPSNV
jgi:hypothetical protein